MYRHGLQAILLAVLMTFSAGAARSATEQDAQNFIQGLAQKAISTVLVPNISDAERQKRFRDLFVSGFDIPEIGKFVLGRYWRKASPSQQQDFLREFEELQVLTWTRRFKDYHGESLKTQGVSKDNSGDWLVNSEILRPQGPPIPVQWRVHQSADGKLRIVDIIPESVSMALTQRQDFASVLQSNGGNIDALLSSIRARNQQLAKAP